MSIKTFAAFAIIIGCFAVLYPRFLSPMFNHLLGFNEKKVEDKQPQYPPGYHKAVGEKPDKGKPQSPEDMRQHFRAGPHPGLRAAADMGRQQSQQGGGRGMMGIVLPMYAVGIVLYLVYTLVKVFNKKDVSQDRGRYGYNRSSGFGGLYDNRESKFTYGDDFSNPDVMAGSVPSRQKQQELEDLLVRADDQNISAAEMRELQRRLEETEAQMSKILQAMKQVSTKVDEVVTDNVSEEPQPEKSKSEERPVDTESVKPVSPDSSPDMESYEIVKKSADSSPVMESAVSKVDIGPEIDESVSPEVNTSPEPAVNLDSEAVECPENDDNMASENPACEGSATESASDILTNPETILPEEVEKRALSEVQETSEQDEDLSENAFVSEGPEMGGDGKEQDVLLEEKQDEEEEHTNVRQRKLPTVNQD